MEVGGLPFTFVLDPVARIVRTTAYGPLRFDDLAAYMYALMEAGLAGVAQLIDARQAQHELSMADIRRFVDLVAQLVGPEEPIPSKPRPGLTATR